MQNKNNISSYYLVNVDFCTDKYLLEYRAYLLEKNSTSIVLSEYILGILWS